LKRAPRFPIRLGAIDVGSNGIRFVAVEYTGPTQFSILDQRRVSIRLGQSAFLTGRLDLVAIDETATALASFRGLIDDLGLRRFRAVATSAVRESLNGRELIEAVRAASGIRVQRISGGEEARLVWLAAAAQLGDPKEACLLVDLGGGSLEASFAGPEGIQWSESHQFGTVRMLAELDSPHRSPRRFQRLLQEYLSGLRFREAFPTQPAFVVATGGNAEAIAVLAEADRDTSGIARVSLASLARVTETLAELTVSERVDRLGLSADRADVILPAAMVFRRVFELAKCDQMVIPFVGLRNGIILDLLDDEIAHPAHVSRVEDQVLRAALAVGRRYRFDENHGVHVARLAINLFDQLQELHGLDEAHRKVLLAAAVLHDVGQFISHRKHHKHSMRLIQNSELPNLSRPELRLVALVARYHRRADPRPNHRGYRRLSEEDRAIVRKLAALLRVADALDRAHSQEVKGVSCLVKKRSVRLRIEGTGDLLVERWALQRKGRLFRAEFGLRLRTRDARTSTGTRSKVQP